ncbi:hypothetical protein [Aquipuribacter nitratireducens]|uniref:Uncharacterized protein n=1 Tax=Aquipuribacter nitratireducens TaxID=650104 RepID=A0ABW0GL19_9MICO
MTTTGGRAAARHQVVLVRTWHDHHGAGGCCGTTDAVGTLGPPDRATAAAPPAEDATGRRYRALRTALPHVRVEVTDSRNWLYLAPWAYRARRAAGAPAAVAARAAARATTPGGVLVDGELLALDPHAPAEEVVAAVRARTGTLQG